MHTVFVHIFFFTNFVCQATMTNKAFQILSWLRHALTATNTHGHGIHSPRLFDLVQYVIDNPYNYYDYRILEQYRRLLLGEDTVINVTDYGTGVSGEKTVSRIAAGSLAPPQQAQLIYRIVEDMRPKHILELGTSLALTTAYMAKACGKATVTTLEGCGNIARRARQTLSDLKCHNVSVIEGNIDDTLKAVINRLPGIGILYIDANHTSEALIKYFNTCLPKLTERAIIIIDDIYWSEDMHNGWQCLTEHEKVTANIDLYHCGLLFLDPHLPRRTFKIRL